MTTAVRSPLGAALGVLLALISLTGPASTVLLAVAVAVLAVMIAVGWPDLAELDSPRGTRIVVIGAGVIAALAALFTADTRNPFAALATVCAAGVFAAFVHQMLRRDRRGLTASLTATIAGMLLAGLGSTWVIAGQIAETTGTGTVVTATAIGLAVTGLIAATDLPGIVRVLGGAVLGGGVTTLLVATLTSFGALAGLAIGVPAAVGAMGVAILLQSSLISREPGPSLTVAAAPAATVGMVALLAVTVLG